MSQLDQIPLGPQFKLGEEHSYSNVADGVLLNLKDNLKVYQGLVGSSGLGFSITFFFYL